VRAALLIKTSATVTAVFRHFMPGLHMMSSVSQKYDYSSVQVHSGLLASALWQLKDKLADRRAEHFKGRAAVEWWNLYVEPANVNPQSPAYDHNRL